MYLDASASSSEYNNLLSRPACLKSLMRWEMVDATQVLRHQGLPPAAAAVLDRLCKCQGQLSLPSLPDGSERESVAEQSEGLRFLEMQGYVSRGEERNGSVLWSLQEHVHSKLCLVARLGKPQPFATSALQTDVKCMTVMELMLLLQKEGFVFQH